MISTNINNNDNEENSNEENACQKTVQPPVSNISILTLEYNIPSIYLII